MTTDLYLSGVLQSVQDSDEISSVISSWMLVRHCVTNEQKILAHGYWPGLHADLAHFVRTCKTCAASKSSHHQRLGTETYSAIPIQPFTSWAMDLIGPMPRSKDGNEWIVTWVDRTSKTIVAAAAAHKHTSAEDLARLTKEI